MNTKLRGSLKQQSYVPLENVTSHVTNKYEAIVVAAAEARKINSVLRMVGRDEAQEKVTSRALRRICTGDIDYVYLDESARIAEAEALAEQAKMAVAEAAAEAAAVPTNAPRAAAPAEAPAAEPAVAEPKQDDGETPPAS